ncbi:MAG TPA: RpiR family transcriptional regulator [Rhizobium sp.]
MPEAFHRLETPPSSFADLKKAVVARRVIFPRLVESVAKKVIEHPELMAFDSAPSIARACGVSTSTVMRFITHIGFRDVAKARGIFREELRRRMDDKRAAG